MSGGWRVSVWAGRTSPLVSGGKFSLWTVTQNLQGKKMNVIYVPLKIRIDITVLIRILCMIQLKAKIVINILAYIIHACTMSCIKINTVLLYQLCKKRCSHMTH